MAKNDPEQLEAEARLLVEQMTNAKKGIRTAAQPDEDTPEEQQEVFQDAPDPTDKAETIAFEDADQHPERGEDEDLRLALDKAEKAMKGAQARMTKATQEAADLKRQNADLFRSLTELKGQLVDQRRDDNKLAQLREDYPDLAGPLLDELKRTQDEVSSTRKSLAEQEQRKSEEVVAEAQQRHFDRIKAVHSDVETLVETSDWFNWLEDQDYQTKEWIQTGSSNDVNNVLDRFKIDVGMVTQTPQERALERARSVAEPRLPKSRKPILKGDKKSWSVDEIMRMPNELFEKHQNEILQAMEGGSIRR